MRHEFIPWAKPSFHGKEEANLLEALRSTWISGGPFVAEFERRMCALCSTDAAFATSNGTTAIHLAYLAAGLVPGDEVIVPGFAFQAAGNIALHMHLKPVFADVARDTWCLDPADVERRITSKTKAVVAVHTYGNLCDMAALRTITRERGLLLIEDAAEGFPSRYGGAYAGSLADIGTFSFHATKPVATGEGGMIMLNDRAMAEKAALYRSHGMKRQDRFYWHEVPGHNFRMTNLQAALGCAQLDGIETIEESRKGLQALYAAQLGDVAGVSFQETTAQSDPVLWAFAVRLDPTAFPQGRDAVIRRMAEANVETRPGFYPASALGYFDAAPLPVCEEIAYSVISLPTYPSLDKEDIAYICSALVRCKQ